jgi:regulatory protein
MDAALHLLKFRRRTERELAERLRRKSVAEDVIDGVLVRLRELALVDDAALARDWIQTCRRAGQGDGRIRQDLRRRGLSSERIDRVFSECAPEEGDEISRAEAALRRRAPRVAALERQVQYRRLAGFLGRQGFSPDAIQSALRRYFSSETDL